jgi:hypothetical protein
MGLLRGSFRPKQDASPGGVFLVGRQPLGVDRFQRFHRVVVGLDHLRPATAVEHRTWVCHIATACCVLFLGEA